MKKFDKFATANRFMQCVCLALAVRKDSTRDDNFYCLVIFRKNVLSDTKNGSTLPISR